MGSLEAHHQMWLWKIFSIAFLEDDVWRGRMMEQRGWDERGESAREADRLALVPRIAEGISFEEREQRGWWRQVAENRPQSGRDTQSTGDIGPSWEIAASSVPGASLGCVGKGDKGKNKGKGKDNTSGKKKVPLRI